MVEQSQPTGPGQSKVEPPQMQMQSWAEPAAEEEKEVITDKQIHEKNLFNIWINSVTTSFKFRLKEHPRSSDHMDRLNEMMKEVMHNYIICHKAPPDNSPSKEEIENAMSGATTTTKIVKERPSV